MNHSLSYNVSVSERSKPEHFLLVDLLLELENVVFDVTEPILLESKFVLKLESLLHLMGQQGCNKMVKIMIKKLPVGGRSNHPKSGKAKNTK